MIKIITPGTRNRIECDYCGALLAYDKEDIQKKEKHCGPCDYYITKYIICPQCRNEVVMEATR